RTAGGREPAHPGARRPARGRGTGQAAHEAGEPGDRRARRLHRVGGGLSLGARLHRAGDARQADPAARLDAGAEGDRDRGRGAARGGAPARDRPPRRQALSRSALQAEARSLQGATAQAGAARPPGGPSERRERPPQRALSATTPWRILFMGTPPFAGTILEALLRRPDPVVGAVCQPDRPRGRGLAIEPPAVKTLALARG